MATGSNDSQSRGRSTDKAALAQSNLKTLKQMFEKMTPALKAALPNFITPERMIRVATTTAQKVPRLLECDPVTLVGAVMQSAQLGLEPDNINGAAYLVPFWNSKNGRFEVQLIPGYKGLMMLARRSRDIGTFDAHVVKSGDVFDFEFGSNQFLRHKPALALSIKDGKWEAPAKEPDTIAAYMIAFYNGGNRAGSGPAPCQFHVMSRAELEDAKEFTKSRDRAGKITGPWLEHPDAMFQKTVIRRGAKLLPFSIEMATAVALDERGALGKSQNLGALVADDLGVGFTPTDDDGDDESGEAGDPDPALVKLVKQIDEGFATLGYAEARKTVRMEEFKGRLPELLEWVNAEVLKNARPAGQGSTTPASTTAPVTAAPTTEREPPPAKAAAPASDGKAKWKL